MKKYERNKLLEKIDKDSISIGAKIPKSVEVQGEEIKIRKLIFGDFDLSKKNNVDYSIVKNNLRKKRKELYKSLEEDELTYKRGLEIVEKISGIDRAINALKGMNDDTDLNKKIEKKEKQDYERWIGFLKKVKGDNNKKRR